MPTGAEAFSLLVVWRIFYVNVFALAGLLFAYRVALAAKLIVKGNEATGTTATAY